MFPTRSQKEGYKADDGDAAEDDELGVLSQVGLTCAWNDRQRMT